MAKAFELAAGPPACVESERALLGTIILSNENFSSASAVLTPSMFSLESHRLIFRAMGEVIEKGSTIEELTIHDSLLKRGLASTVGGLAYLSSLSEGCYRRTSVADHIEIIAEHWRLRALMKNSESVWNLAAGLAPSEDLIADIQQTIEAVNQQGTQHKSLLADHIVGFLDDFRADRIAGARRGIPCGIDGLDARTGGMMPGEVSIIGARPGIGKTSLLAQAVVETCRRGHGAAVFSYEMTRRQFFDRLVAMVCDVPHTRLRHPHLASPVDEQLIRGAAAQIAEWNLHIWDRNLPLAQMCALAGLAVQKYKVKLIGCDYARIVPVDPRTDEDPRKRVSTVSRKLTGAVKKTDAHLMLLSQLRKPSSREQEDRPPRLGDLRETGELEDNAHCIVLLHRERDEEKQRPSFESQLILAKQRGGELGVIDAAFNPRRLAFEGSR